MFRHRVLDFLPKNAVRRKLCVRRDSFNPCVSWPGNSILVRIKEIGIPAIAFVLDVTVNLLHPENVRTAMSAKSIECQVDSGQRHLAFALSSHCR
jgi:hypothetical protein